MGWPSKRPGGDLVAGNLTACVQSVRGNELLYVGDYIGGGHEARLAASSACNDTWRVLRVGQAIAQIMDGHISSIIYIRTYTIHINLYYIRTYRWPYIYIHTHTASSVYAYTH